MLILFRSATGNTQHRWVPRNITVTYKILTLFCANRRGLAGHYDVVRLSAQRSVLRRARRQDRRQLLRVRFRFSVFHIVLRAVFVFDHKPVRGRHNGQLRLFDP